MGVSCQDNEYSPMFTMHYQQSFPEVLKQYSACGSLTDGCTLAIVRCCIRLDRMRTPCMMTALWTSIHLPYISYDVRCRLEGSNSLHLHTDLISAHLREACSSHPFLHVGVSFTHDTDKISQCGAENSLTHFATPPTSTHYH